MPSALIAGDSLRWDRSIADYPPSAGWTLHYAFRGIEVLDVVAAANAAGTGYEITVAASATATLRAGTYEVTEYVTNAGGERYTLARGTLTVRADPTTAAPGDRQSHEERMVPLLEAALERRVTIDQKAYQLTSVTATREELKDMSALLGRYRAALAARRNGGRLRPIGIRFVRGG